MQDQIYIGLDIGTSSTKAVAFAAQGQVIGEEHMTYKLQYPIPGAVVQDPIEIIEVVEEVLSKLLKQLAKAPKAIGISAVMHSLLAVKKTGEAISPIWTWADRRAEGIAEQLKDSELGIQFFQATGTPIHAMSPLCKLAHWKKTNDPAFGVADLFVDIKSYLIHHWFGHWVCDQSVASASGMLELASLDWYSPALEYLDISPEQLPQLVAPNQAYSAKEAPFLSQFGLEDCQVIIGAADGCLANLGCAVLSPDQVCFSMGSSAALRTTIQVSKVDPLRRLFTYYLAENYYVTGAASNNGGKAWDWFCQTFFPDKSMGEVIALTRQMPIGAAGLRCLPYVYGERAPLWQAGLTARFDGYHAQHRLGHSARAFLEGLFFNMQLCLDSLKANFGAARHIVATGGFIQSPSWVQLLADLSHCEVLVADSPHATALGAAILAQSQVENRSLASLVKDLNISQRYLPQADQHSQLQEHFTDWKKTFSFED